MFLEICSVTKVVLFFFFYHAVFLCLNKIQTFQNEIITSSSSPQSGPCFSLQGCVIHRILLFCLKSWETFHTTIAATVQVAIWVPCVVFLLAMGAVFGSQTENGLRPFPLSTVPAAGRPGRSSSITVHREGGQTLWVGWENKICTIWIWIKLT